MRNPLVTQLKELIILKHHNGVKLVKPCNLRTTDQSHSVGSILNIPLNVYFQNTDSEILAISERSIETCGFASERDAIGHTIRRVATSTTADQIIENNYLFLKSPQPTMVLEPYVRRDEFEFEALSFKYPWYDENNNLGGIFGFSFISGMDTASSLAESYHLLMKLNLIAAPTTNQISQFASDKYKLTAREKNITELIIRGKTAKEIAAVFLLSRRTVEHYIENLKHKVGARSKSELIERLLPLC